MKTHQPYVKSLALSAVVLAVVVVAAIGGTSTDDKDKPMIKPTPSSVKEVVAKPLADEFEKGNIQLNFKLDPKRAMFPRGPQTGEKLQLKENEVERVVKLQSARLNNWQKKYVMALKTAKEVVNIQDRQQLRQAAPTAIPQAPTVEEGKETKLVAFQGLPALPPVEEELLIKNCLMITDLKVVEDPKRTCGLGVWTFGHLMTEMANEKATGIKPADFVERWLTHWQHDQRINGFTIPNRKRGIEQLILNHWPRTKATGELNLAKAPFRLLAIISRLDLRSNLVLGAERIGGGGAGEARFVFCAVDKDGNPLAFTVIFEYGIKKRDYPAVRHWAEQWYALKKLPLGSQPYNQALEEITNQFVTADADPESPLNCSALSQLRTNEIDLVLKVPPQPPAQAVWEVREFRIDANNDGFLRQVTVKQTPDLGFNNQPVLSDFIKENLVDILHKKHRTPADFPAGQDFLAGSAITPANLFWNAADIKQLEARHLFSLGTCSGCHAREAFPAVGKEAGVEFDNVSGPKRQPPHFTHVRPRLAGDEAQLSAFLTGKNPAGKDFFLPDPVTPTATRRFKDLSNRAHDLHGIIEYGTYYEMWRLPQQKVH